VRYAYSGCPALRFATLAKGKRAWYNKQQKMGLPEKKHKEFELRKEKACQMICHHFRLIH
jgi:hypothetical protein